MSPFTEAHFAAALLHCGPHVSDWQNHHTPADDYLNRVYAYFFELFPRKVDLGDVYMGQHEWHVFWREYLAWMGEKL